MAETIAKAMVALVPDTQGLSKSLDGLGGKLGGQFGKLGETAGGKLDAGLKGALGKVTALGPQGALAVAAIGGAVAIGAALYKVGADFNTAYNKIQKQTGATGKELDALKGSFKNVAKQTGASFEDISSSVAKVSQRTGATGQDLENLSLQMLRLSSVTGTDLNSNIEKATGLFNGWKISTADMPKYLDKLYVASAKSGVGVDQLMAAAEKSGPIMRQFNFSFDESVALLATFDKAGLNSATATTALNAALKNQQKQVIAQGKVVDKAGKELEKFQALQDTKPSPENKKNLEEAIKNYEELNGAFQAMQKESPAEFLAATIESIKNTGDVAAANQEAISVFGAKAGPQLAEAIRAGTISMDELVEAMGGAEGTLKSTAKETATIGGIMKKMGNQVKVAIEPLATGLFKGLENAFKTIAPYLCTFISLVGDILGVLASLIGWVTKCKPLMIALGVALGILVVAFLALTHPVALVVIAIIAIVTVVKNLWETNEGFRNAITTIWGAVVKVFTSPVEVIKAAFRAISDAIDWVIDAAKAVFKWVTDNWPLLAQIFVAIFVPGGPILVAIYHFREEILGVINKIIDWFKKLPEKIITGLGNLGQKLLDWVTAAWEVVGGGITNAASTVLTWFASLPEKFAGGLTGMGQKILDKLSAAWGFVAAGVGKAAKATLDWFKELPGKLVRGIGSAADLGAKLISWARDAFKSLTAKLGDIGSEAIAFFKKLPGQMIGALGDLGKQIVPDLSGLEKLPGQVKRAMDDVVETVKGLPGRMVGALGDMADKVKDTVGGALGSVTSSISGLGGQLADKLKDLPNQITGALGGLKGSLTEMGSQMLGGLSNGMRSASEWVVAEAKKIPGKVKGAIGDAGQMLLAAGRQVIGGFTNGIRAASSWIGDWVRKISGWVTGAVGDAAGWLKGKGQDIIRGLWERGIGTMKGWLEAKLKIGPWVWNAIGNAKAWLVNVGKHVIEGLWNGIWAKKDWLVNKVKGLLGSIRNLLPFSPPKDPTSPFAGRGQPFYSGISIATQLAEGMAKATPLVVAAAHDLAGAAQLGLGAQVYDLSAVGRGMAGELADRGRGRRRRQLQPDHERQRGGHQPDAGRLPPSRAAERGGVSRLYRPRGDEDTVEPDLPDDPTAQAEVLEYVSADGLVARLRGGAGRHRAPDAAGGPLGGRRPPDPGQPLPGRPPCRPHGGAAHRHRGRALRARRAARPGPHAGPHAGHGPPAQHAASAPAWPGAGSCTASTRPGSTRSRRTTRTGPGPPSCSGRPTPTGSTRWSRCATSPPPTSTPSGSPSRPSTWPGPTSWATSPSPTRATPPPGPAWTWAGRAPSSASATCPRASAWP